MNHGVKNGLIYGGLSVIISLALYLVNPEMMFKPSIGLIMGLVLSLFFMIKAAREEKADNDGILTYGEAVKTTFVVLLIATFISQIFMYFMMTVIDPSLVDTFVEVQIKSSEWSAEMMGANEEVLDQMRETIEEQDSTPTLGKTLSQFVVGAVMSLLYSLIVSAFVKKNPTLA